tara:strand:+ start:39 stop:251 length:213 start_codon:yes stop_codon:yes gene_type:complete
MNYKDYTEGTRSTYGDDPTEWSGPELERCSRCDNDILTPEEVEEKMCFDCMEELEIQDENSNSRNLANER